MPNKENDTQTYERLLNAIERNIEAIIMKKFNK